MSTKLNERTKAILGRQAEPREDEAGRVKRQLGEMPAATEAPAVKPPESKEEAKSEVQKILDEYAQAEAGLRQEYEVAKEDVEKRRLREQLTHAFTKLAAGLYGLQSGMDLSGIALQPRDWDRMLERAQRDRASGLSSAKERLKTALALRPKAATPRPAQQTDFLDEDGRAVVFEPNEGAYKVAGTDEKVPADKLRSARAQLRKNPETGEYESWDPVSRSWGPQSGADKELTVRQQQQIDKGQSTFGARTAKISSALGMISPSRAAVQLNNPISAEAAKTLIPRASSEVGNLAAAEQERFGGAQALMAKLDQLAERLTTGKLTPDNQRFILEYLDALEYGHAKQLEKKAEDFIKQKSKVYGMEAEELRPYFIPDSIQAIIDKYESDETTKTDWAAKTELTAKEFVEQREPEEEESAIERAWGWVKGKVGDAPEDKQVTVIGPGGARKTIPATKVKDLPKGWRVE